MLPDSLIDVLIEVPGHGTIPGPAGDTELDRKARGVLQGSGLNRIWQRHRVKLPIPLALLSALALAGKPRRRVS